jgi:hypothetical protein
MSATPLRAPERSRQQAASGRKLQRLAEQARSRQGTETAQDRARDRRGADGVALRALRPRAAGRRGAALLRPARASEHLDAAHAHDQMARERETWPETRPAAPGDLRPVSLPWYRSWDTAGEHGRLADVHRAQAAEIHAQYDEACRDLPASDARLSPLQVHGIGGWNTTTGVILYLSPDAGPPDQLIARMKCHRAAMMLAPSTMEDCPLDLPGIALDARGDDGGITVSVVVRNPDLVLELQRRAAHELEAAAQLHAKQP